MPRNATSRTSTKSSSKRSTAKASSTDAIRILTEDHKKVLEMFKEFKKMKKSGSTDDEAKQMLVETVCAELSIHTQVEEELFYPSARDAIDDMDLLDEAEVEHASARQLISELSAMQPDDDLYDAKFTVLGEYVQHHIEEEEKQLFPKVKKTDLDLAELGEEIRDRKLELREELGVPSEDEEESESETASSQGRKTIH